MNATVTVTKVKERPIEGSKQIEAVAIMSDGTEVSLMAFYPDERISFSGLIGLTEFEASKTVTKRFSEWLLQDLPFG